MKCSDYVLLQAKLKKCVFSLIQKAEKAVFSRISAGSEFQEVEPANENASAPKFMNKLVRNVNFLTVSETNCLHE